MQIEQRATRDLVPYIRNARTHSPEQVAQIAASIARFGFVNPILIGEDDVVIAGHGRLEAAISLGLAEVPVIVLAHLNEVERRALVIADNRIAENAGWDEGALARELAAIREADEDFDLGVLGFGEEQIGDLLTGLEEGLFGPGGLGHTQNGSGGGSGGGGGGGGGGLGGGGSTEPPPPSAPKVTLAERFGIPPFTILDARRGWWQERKRSWLALGIRSELGRGEDDRASPGGSPMPGRGSRKDYVLGGVQAGPAKAYHDGVVKGQGGFSDQMAAAAEQRKKAKEGQNNG